MDTDGAGDNAHDVLGERSGLVGADDGGVCYRLTRTENTNEEVLSRPFRGESERKSDRRREALRNSNSELSGCRIDLDLRRTPVSLRVTWFVYWSGRTSVVIMTLEKYRRCCSRPKRALCPHWSWCWPRVTVLLREDPPRPLLGLSGIELENRLQGPGGVTGSCLFSFGDPFMNG